MNHLHEKQGDPAHAHPVSYETMLTGILTMLCSGEHSIATDVYNTYDRGYTCHALYGTYTYDTVLQIEQQALAQTQLARVQVRDFVRRRRWLRHRVRKPAEPSQSFVSRQSEAPSELAGPSLSRASMASSSGTGPIPSRPTHNLAASGRSVNGSFTSQQGVSQRSLGSQGAVGDRTGSFTSVSGASPGQSAGQSLVGTQQALSSQCNKWGNSTVNELHRAISSVEGDNASVARDSMHSDDYVGNSPMSAGLNRLSGPAQAFQPSGLGASTHLSSDSVPPIATASSSQGQFVRESTPQTLGTAGGIPVAPHLAQATGHANIPGPGPFSQSLSGTQFQSRFSNTPIFGGDVVQHPQSEAFPSAEELSPERSNPSAPAAIGQVRQGDMAGGTSMAAFPASVVAASLSRPEDSHSVAQAIDQQSLQSPTVPAASHHHAFEKPGVLMAQSVPGSSSTMPQ